MPLSHEYCVCVWFDCCTIFHVDSSRFWCKKKSLKTFEQVPDWLEYCCVTLLPLEVCFYSSFPSWQGFGDLGKELYSGENMSLNLEDCFTELVVTNLTLEVNAINV